MQQLQHKDTTLSLENQEFNEIFVKKNSCPSDSVLNVTTSLFAHYKARVNKKVNLYDFLINSTYKDAVLKIRSLDDKKERDRLKANLPAVTPSAVFAKARIIEHAHTQTTLICLDFDNCEKIQSLFLHLQNLPFVAYAGLSVGGKGLFAICHVSKNLLQHYFALEKLFFDNGYTVDRSCKDVTRLRGATYDPTAYINHYPSKYTDTLSESAVYTKEPQTSLPATKITYLPTTYTKVTKAVQIALKRASDKGLSFTDGNRCRFVLYIASLLNRFGIDANNAFFELDSAIGISNYQDHKKRFFDVFVRYANQFGSLDNKPVYSQQTAPTAALTTQTQTDAPAAHTEPVQKKVFAPLIINPKHNLTFDKYLSQAPNFKEICTEILTTLTNLWLIDAPTRAGKTYAFTHDFAPILQEQHPQKIVLFVNPLRVTTDQTSQSTQGFGDGTTFCNSILTWDKALSFLRTNKDRLHDVVLIIDEIHDLIKAANYKANVISQMYTYFNKCFKVIGLSGTPFGVLEQFGFSSIKATSSTPAAHNTNVILCDPKNTSSELVNLLTTTLQGQNNLIFCPTASDTHNTSVTTLSNLVSKFKLNSDFVWSGNKTTNETAIYIKQNKCLPVNKNNVFVTSVFQSGMTLECDNIVFLNPSGKIDFAGMWQSLSRNTTNRVRNYYIIQPPTNEPEQPKYDFNLWQVKREIERLNKMADGFTLIKESIKDSDNRINYKLPFSDLIKATNGAIIWSEPAQKYIVCPFVLLNQQYTKITASYTSTDLVGFFEQIPNNIVTVTDKTKALQNELTGAISDVLTSAAKEQQQSDKDAISQILANDTQTKVFFKTLSTITEDINLKTKLHTFAGVVDTSNNDSIYSLCQRNLKLCQLAATRFIHLNKQYLGAINRDKLSVWCVESNYNYGMLQHRLTHTSILTLLTIHNEHILPNIVNDDKASLKVKLAKNKIECLLAIQAEQKNQNTDELKASDVLKIVWQFEPNMTADGLNSYLKQFCEVITRATNGNRYIKIKILNYSEFLDSDSFIKAFNELSSAPLNIMF